MESEGEPSFQNYFKKRGANLLTIITVGIYGLWVGIKLKKWKATHKHFAD